MNEDDLKRLGDLIQKQRKTEYGTKSAAYQEAGLNAATWDRAEAGLPIREDRMTAVLRTLFGASATDPEVVLARAGRHQSVAGVAFGPDLDGPDGAIESLASWTQDSILRINDTLADLADAIEEIQRKVGLEHGDSSAEKSVDDPDEGGGSVTRFPRRPNPSAPGETVAPAALDKKKNVDEEPGGSGHDEG